MEVSTGSEVVKEGKGLRGEAFGRKMKMGDNEKSLLIIHKLR